MITVNNRGSSTYTSIDTINISPDSNCTANATVLLFLSYDNSDSGADPFSTITDSKGNTWTSLVNDIRSPNSITSDGTVLRIFSTNQNSGALVTTDTINVVFNITVNAICALVLELTSANTINYIDSSTTVLSGNDVTITTNSLTSTDVVFGMAASNWNTSIYGDSDTLNGSWSSGLTKQSDYGGIYNQQIIQYKIVTGTDAQTYDVTFGEGGSSAQEIVQAYIVYSDYVPSAPTSKTFIMITSMTD